MLVRESRKRENVLRLCVSGWQGSSTGVIEDRVGDDREQSFLSSGSGKLVGFIEMRLTVTAPCFQLLVTLGLLVVISAPRPHHPGTSHRMVPRKAALLTAYLGRRAGVLPLWDWLGQGGGQKRQTNQNKNSARTIICGGVVRNATVRGTTAAGGRWAICVWAIYAPGGLFAFFFLPIFNNRAEK